MKPLCKPLCAMACLLTGWAALAEESRPLEVAEVDTTLLSPGDCQASHTPGTDAAIPLEPVPAAEAETDAAMETVDVRVPLLLQPGETVQLEDLSVRVTAFRLSKDLDIIPLEGETVELALGGRGPVTGGLRLWITFTVPAEDCYGYTVHISHGDKVLHCIASSDELLPQEPAADTPAPDTEPAEPPLLPTPTEEAVPYSDFLKDNPRPDA